MRLHRLTATAFGPFPGAVEVDFDALCAPGLFLVHGPTGSGKTSLLDAVCFALFADVPGHRSAKNLRSDHAPVGAVPSVELEFTSGVRRLRVQRRPAFDRPKKRGDGTVRVQATVVLEELRASRWEVLSTRLDEVAHVVDDVVGMGKEQFAKVVMLPQGDFAAFLRATPEERRALLERLFDISRFSDVESWLARARRDAEAHVAAVRSALETELVRLADVLAHSGLVGPPGAGLTPDSPDLLDAIVLLRSALDEHVVTTMARFDMAAGTEDEATSAHEVARARSALAARAAAARAGLESLVAVAGEREDDRSRLGLSRRAASVEGHLAALGRARAEAAASDEAVSETLAAVDQLGVAGRGGDPTESDVREVAQQVAAFDEPVATLLRSSLAVEARSEAIAELGAEVHGAEHALTCAEEALLVSTAEEAAARTEVRDLTAVDAGIGALLGARDAAAERAGLVERIRHDEERIIVVRAEVDDARARFLDARELELSLRARRLEGISAELAAALRDHEPCPVCGSVDHPEPAAPSRDQVTAAQVDQAAADSAHHEGIYRKADDALTTLTAAIADRRLFLGEETDLDRITKRLVAAEAALSAARSTLVALGDARDRERAASEDLADAALLRGSAAEQLAGLRARQAALRAEDESAWRDLVEGIREHRSSCPCATDVAGGWSPESAWDGEAARPSTAPAVITLAKAHRDASRRLEACVTALRTHSEAGTRLDAACSETAAAARRGGFADADSARAALLAEPEVAALAERLAAYDADRLQARAVLDDPDVAAAARAPTPDLGALAAAASAARAALLAARDAQNDAQRAHTQFAAVAGEVLGLVRRLGPLQTRFTRVKDLADTVAGLGGNNAMRMRLTSFVLAERLERVAALANARLAVMGEGRYLLEHCDDRAAGGARSGLGLRVLDQWTGASRDTSTLSGGESFMASLALALGLADAVRAESGGFELGTLFIDEGFGTLDEDSLEQVLAVLDGLREGGRAVGVVSHVAELRSRIESQIVVRKTPRGSTVAVSAPGTESAA